MLPPKPGRPKGGSSYKNPFEHSPGRIKYASPVAKQDALRVFKRPNVHKPLNDLEKARRKDAQQHLLQWVMQTERVMMQSLLGHRSINLVVINETKQKLNAADLERGMAGMPGLITRVGSVFLSYKVRIAKNWLDDIGNMDIVIAVSDDDRPQIYDADRPQPSSGYKLNVHIPELLLSRITSGALAFVEPLDRLLQQDDTLALYSRRIEQAQSRFGWPDALDNTETYYNARLDMASAATRLYRGRKLLGLNPRRMNTWNMARSIRKQMRPYFRVDASQLNRQLNWIGSKVGQDVQVLPIIKTSSKALNSAAKELGTLGSLLTLGLIYQKVSSDTWTASTVVDGALLFAGIALAVAGFEAIAAVSVGYGLVDFVTGDSLSSLWDEVFPRNRPFSPPAHSFYVNH